MGAGNWMLPQSYEDEHRGEFFYVNIPFDFDDDPYGDTTDRQFWDDELIEAVQRAIPDSFWKTNERHSHWGRDFLVVGESTMYFIGLVWCDNRVVVCVALKQLSQDYWQEQERNKNIGHHATSIRKRLIKELLPDYELWGRRCAWTSYKIEKEM